MPPTRAHRHNREKLSEMTVTDDLTEFRGQYRLWRHLLLPAAAVLFLFPCAGSFIRAYTLVNLLPFVALGWLCLGVIAAGVLRAKRPRTP